MKSKKSWAILAGLLALAALLFFLLRLGEEQFTLEDIVTGPNRKTVQIETQGEWRFVRPKGAKGRYDLLLVFGGMYYATPQFMMEQSPRELFDKCVLVFAPCRYTGGPGGKAALKRALDWCEKQKLDIRRISVCGFSGGGSDALEVEDSRLYVLGLIDPEPKLPAEPKALEAASKIFLSYRKLNWSGNPSYGEVVKFAPFEDLSLVVRRAGGRSAETEIRHKDYPKFFLYKYRKYF